MTVHEIMGIISSVALLVPVIAIIASRLAHYATYPALLVYYLTIFLYNLMSQGQLPVSDTLIHYWGLTNNMLDAPLMLIFLSYLYPSGEFIKKMRWVTLGYVVYEVAVVAVLGYNLNAMTIILGPGIVIVAGFAVYFFARYAKQAIETQKSVGKAFIGASLLLAYGSYLLIYIMFYLVKTKEVADTFLLYYMVSVIASSLLTAGIVIEGRRVRKLRELYITRRELQELYKDVKMGPPRRRVPMLDFDRELLNSN